MSKEFRISKNDSYDLGFALDCVFGIISLEEFHEWIIYVIGESDEVPNYMFDALDVERKIEYFKVDNVFGYAPHWSDETQENRALEGIGYKRFENYKSDFVSKKIALKALDENPNIAEKFKELFPFIDLNFLNN